MFFFKATKAHVEDILYQFLQMLTFSLILCYCVCSYLTNNFHFAVNVTHLSNLNAQSSATRLLQNTCSSCHAKHCWRFNLSVLSEESHREESIIKWIIYKLCVYLTCKLPACFGMLALNGVLCHLRLAVFTQHTFDSPGECEQTTSQHEIT